MNMKKNLALYPTLITTLALASACGNSSTSTTSGISSIAAVPNTTDGVGASAALLDSSLNASSTTGNSVSGAGGIAWSGKSKALCELTQMVRDMYKETAQADRMKCMVGLFDKNGFINNAYDGNDHYLVPGGAGGSGNAPKIKFSATKDATSGAVTAFKIYTCFQGTTQDNFVSLATNADGTITLTTVGAHAFGTAATGGSRSTISGGIDANGKWTSKTITHDGSFGASGTLALSMGQSLTATQTADTLSVDGWRKGTLGSASQSRQVVAKAQIINSSSGDKLAVGDGSAQFKFVDGVTAVSGTVSWNGDTGNRLTDPTTGIYYNDVSSATLPAIGTPNTAFQTGETWDCTVPAGVTPDKPNFAALTPADRQSCDKLDFGAGAGAPIDCGVGN